MDQGAVRIEVLGVQKVDEAQIKVDTYLTQEVLVQVHDVVAIFLDNELIFLNPDILWKLFSDLKDPFFGIFGLGYVTRSLHLEA